MGLPAFFLHVDLGNEVLSDPTANTNVESLNFAVVMEDAEAPVQARWSTWGLEADSLLLYQRQNKPNTVLVGNNGYVYAMVEGVHSDAGAPIDQRMITTLLPSVDDNNDAQSMTRVMRVKWGIATTPPDTGIPVTVTLIDADTGEEVSRSVVQYTNLMEVEIAMRCRQFRIMFEVASATDYDFSYLAYTYQRMGARRHVVLT